MDDPAAATGSSQAGGGFYASAVDGTTVIYTISVPFMSGTTVPDVRWNDGTKNTFDYASTDVGGCGSSNLISVMSSKTIADADLVIAGTAANGDAVFTLSNPDHPFLKNFYDNGYYPTDGRPKMSYSDFIAAKPVFFWHDPFGRLIKFQRSIFQPAGECGKPVIYLYPEQTTDVSVQIDPKGGLTKSEPAYDGGWQVTAQPDGTLTDKRDGKTYPYLFWEGRGGLYERPNQGDVVSRADVHGFLSGHLAALGLNAKETADFEEFWEPRMQSSPYYFVSFMTNRVMDELAPLTISPAPKHVLRVLMDFTPLDQPIAVDPPNPPAKFVRDGFTVVEWGGVLR